MVPKDDAVRSGFCLVGTAAGVVTGLKSLPRCRWPCCLQTLASVTPELWLDTNRAQTVKLDTNRAQSMQDNRAGELSTPGSAALFREAPGPRVLGVRSGELSQST